MILNALRALRQPEVAAPLSASDTALARRFSGEHESTRANIEELRAAADALGVVQPAEAIARVTKAHRLLVEEVEPHEEAEQSELYPALNRLLGGDDPTATMSRAHAEISHQIRRLGQLLDDIGTGEPDQVDIADLRGLLYGLHAILRLHTAQEDESYLSLAEEAVDAAQRALRRLGKRRPVGAAGYVSGPSNARHGHRSQRLRGRQPGPRAVGKGHQRPGR